MRTQIFLFASIGIAVGASFTGGWDNVPPMVAGVATGLFAHWIRDET